MVTSKALPRGWRPGKVLRPSVTSQPMRASRTRLCGKQALCHLTWFQTGAGGLVGEGADSRQKVPGAEPHQKSFRIGCVTISSSCNCWGNVGYYPRHLPRPRRKRFITWATFCNVHISNLINLVIYVFIWIWGWTQSWEDNKKYYNDITS